MLSIWLPLLLLVKNSYTMLSSSQKRFVQNSCDVCFVAYTPVSVCLFDIHMLVGRNMQELKIFAQRSWSWVRDFVCESKVRYPIYDAHAKAV